MTYKTNILTFLMLFLSINFSFANYNNVNKTPSSNVLQDENTQENQVIEKEEIEYEETNKEEEITEVIVTKKVKIYINPSVQTKNVYINGKGTEASNMYDIARYMKDELDKIPYLDCYYNLSYLSLKESVAESNKINVDIHLALHSNAGGGKGSEIFTISSYAFANEVYNGFNELGSFTKRGVKQGTSLYELKNTKAKDTALIEMLFHDNMQEANWIVSNKKQIASKLVNTLKSYVEKNYL